MLHRIFDTGATRSAVSERTATQLALRKIGTAAVYTAAGAVKQNFHAVNFVLPNKILIPAHIVFAAKLHGYDVLIGMDIIGLSDFIISRRNGFIAFEFSIYMSPPTP